MWLDQDTIFVHPHAPDQPSDDPLLRGSVTLNLQGTRAISKIRVQLRGVITMHGGGDYRYETNSSLLKTLEIEIGAQRLEKGEHRFNFAFIVPSNTAVSERSKFGTVRHTVRAVCEGLGAFGTTIASLYVPLWIIANPSPQGELPEGLEVVVQDFGAEVGPLAFTVSSAHLTVASLLFLNISFLAPPALTIMSVTGYIAQQFTVTYDDPSIGTAAPTSQKKLLFYVDQTTREKETTEEGPNLIERGNVGKGASLPAAYESRRLNPKPFAELLGEKEWSYSRIVRIPDDDHVRPTTLEHTETRIRVKHRLIAEVKYRMAGSKKDMVLSMSTDVTIASCCCLNDSLLLPSYAASAPVTIPVRPFHRRCLCNQTLRQMVEKHGAELERAESRPRSQSSPPVLVPKLGLPGEFHRLGRPRSAVSLAGVGMGMPRRRF